MSRSIALVGVSGAASLQGFASALVGKVTGNAASLVSQPVQGNGANVSIGATAPKGTHTAVVQLEGEPSPAYKGVKAVLVRAVLPAGDAPLPLRDALDVLPGAGISAAAEIAAAKESFAKTAQVAIDIAKAQGSKKITLAVKQATKFANINTLFQDVVSNAASAAGITVEAVGTAQVSNTFIMFPEQLGVVVTADTAAAENIEGLYAGILGGAARTYYTEEGLVAGGNSAFSVARAVSKALSNGGFSAEAKKIESALAKAKPNDAQSIIAAL
jgi:hypothetical protein